MATFASVNSFHYWLVIRRFLTCSTTTPSFTCWEICSLSESAVKTLGQKATPLKLCSLPQAAILFMETASSAWSCYDRHFHIVPIGGQILHISILEKSCCLSYWAWEMPDSRQILYFLTYVVVSGFPQSFNLSLSTNYKVFRPSSSSLTSHFRGHLLQVKIPPHQLRGEDKYGRSTKT